MKKHQKRRTQSITGVMLTLLMPAVLSVLASCGAEEQVPLVSMDYSGWEQTVDEPILRTIPGHGETVRRIFINDVGASVEPQTSGSDTHWDYPDGTVIVKEVFSGEAPDLSSDPDALAVMIKNPDDERARGDWIWVVRDVASGAERIFDNTYCITCHGDANENHPYMDGNPEEEFRDYVFFPYRRSGS